MNLAEFRVRDVGVDLGRGDGGVAEEFLNGADIRAIFEQGSGERVTERMSGNIFYNPGAQSSIFDHVRDKKTGKSNFIRIQKGRVDIF